MNYISHSAKSLTCFTTTGHSRSPDFHNFSTRFHKIGHNSGSFVHNFQDSCYTIDNIYTEEKTAEERKSKMSFVGIMKNKNGMVAFADRRSSYMVGNVAYPAGYTTKAYKGQNFLFVTYGFNEVSTQLGITIPLQKVIENVNPNKYADYRNYFENLHQELLRLNTFMHLPQFDFIIGYKHSFQYVDEVFEGYALANCILTENGVQYTPSNYNALYGGDLQFLPQVTDVLPDWTLDEMSDYAKHLVSDSIYYSSKLYGKHAGIGGEPHIISMV